MNKVKLNRVLFEFMEKMTKEGKYNYEQFIHELSRFVEYFYNLYHNENLREKELAPYFRGDKKEETLEKLLKAYMFGYEKEIDTYTIVLFERDDFEFVIWEVDCKYDVAKKEEYHEDEVFRKSFTREEIMEKFPDLWPLARKNKNETMEEK